MGWQRLHHRDSRRSAAARSPEPARTAGRRSAGRKGHLRHGRGPHDIRLFDLRRPRPEAYGTGRGATGGSRRDRGGQDEHARVRLGGHEPNPHWGTVANPVLPGRVAGGSSGGTAAALADHLATIGLGTDTGGSVRIPAACCGVVGFKPAYGAVSKAGVFPLAPSLDTVGPMARTVADAALVDSVLTGRPCPLPRLAGLRIGVLAATGIEDVLADLGALVEPAALPEFGPDLMAAFEAECAVTHIPWFPRERERYGPDLQVKLDRAQQITRGSMAQRPGSAPRASAPRPHRLALRCPGQPGHADRSAAGGLLGAGRPSRQ